MIRSVRTESTLTVAQLAADHATALAQAGKIINGQSLTGIGADVASTAPAPSAGKAVQVLAEDASDALTVLRELGPDGVWLTVSAPFQNADRACEFLDAVHQLSS